MIFKKSESTPGGMTYADAVEKYKAAAGDLFIKPKRSLCKFEKNAWILFDKDNALIAILSASHGAVFADNLNCALRQVALSHVK